MGDKYLSNPITKPNPFAAQTHQSQSSAHKMIPMAQSQMASTHPFGMGPLTPAWTLMLLPVCAPTPTPYAPGSSATSLALVQLWSVSGA